MTATREEVLTALRGVSDPVSGDSVVAAGIVEGVRVTEGRVQVILGSPQKDAAKREALCAICEERILRLKGVEKAQVVLTAHKPPPASSPSAAAKENPSPPLDLSFTKRIIAVASGKGGVGKSFVAVNLAAAFASLGFKTGLLDADIYGPSVPHMLGLHDKPDMDAHKRIIPHDAHHMRVMSLGFLVDPDRAMIWRGPMVHGALTQMLRDVAWGRLDCLFVDMPPGTGDAPLTLVRTGHLSGVVLVCTPQEVALLDLRRALAMFRRLEIPILGVVENMAWLEGRDGERVALFGEGGAERLAREEGLAFLGAIPLNPAAREGSDMGKITAQIPEARDLTARFESIAQKIAEGQK